MWTAAVAGATAGALHSISGADHIGALLPLCINRRWWSAWIVGFNWGLGHGFGAAVLGLFGFFVKDKLALNAFSDRFTSDDPNCLQLDGGGCGHRVDRNRY
eukprot:Selendium_serpulae@DN5427_c1_g1_i3.p2